MQAVSNSTTSALDDALVIAQLYSTDAIVALHYKRPILVSIRSHRDASYSVDEDDTSALHRIHLRPKLPGHS